MNSSTSLIPRHFFLPPCRAVRISSPTLLLPSSSSRSSSPSPSHHRPFSSTPSTSAPSSSRPSSSSTASAGSSSSSSSYKPKPLPNKPHPAFARMQREKEAAHEAAVNRHEVVDVKKDSLKYYWDAYKATPPLARLWGGIALLAAGYLGITQIAPGMEPPSTAEDIKPISIVRKDGTVDTDLVEKKEREMRLMREEIRLMRAENEVNEKRRREGKSQLEVKAGGKSGGWIF